MVVKDPVSLVQVVEILIANHVWLDIIYKIQFALNVMMDAILVLDNQIIVKPVLMDIIRSEINVFSAQ